MGGGGGPSGEGWDDSTYEMASLNMWQKATSIVLGMYSTVRTSNFLASKTKCAVPCMGSET